MEYCSYGRVVGCLVGISGVLVAAMFAAVTALAVEASSPICPGQRCWRLQRRRRWKRRLQSATAGLSSGVVGRSVCVGGVGGGNGDIIYECVFCGVDAG